MKTQRLSVPAALVVLVVAGAASGQEAAELEPADILACPFTPAEIQAALELEVEPGESAVMVFPGGRDVACSYSVKGRSTIVTVRQTWGVLPAPVESAESVQSSGAADAPAAKRKAHVKLRRIPDDPDGARWLLESASQEADVDKVKLRYKRAANRVDTELTVYGGFFKTVDIQTKLLKLKRVP